MAAKKTNDITLTIAEAKAILELYDNCERGDTVYKACQSDLFRNLIHGTYKAKGVADAIANLRAKVSEAE